MTIARPHRLEEALDALAALPGAHLLAGGTDFMVEVNFGHRRPEHIVALRRVSDLAGWEATDDEIVLRANLTYTQIERELADLLPALAAASRTVGSPQIRNAGTVAGNVATASPAGDTLPLLAAMDATVALRGGDGARTVPLTDLVTGPKQTTIRPGELITELRMPRVRGPQHFAKIGPRNAMVISVACCALVLDLDARRARCGLGSVAAVPLRPRAAEDFISGEIDWDGPRASPDAVRRFGELAAEATDPITDQRGTARYRRHSAGVLARRLLERSLRS